MEVIASNTLEFNTKHGQNLGVDVDAIFEHPLKYRVTASPKVNVRESPSATSRDIGDKLFEQVIKISHITINQSSEAWGKLWGEPGYILMAWLEKKNV